MFAKKIVYIVSNVQKSLAFEWIAEELSRCNISVSFILLNPGESDLEFFLHQRNFKVYRVSFHGIYDAPIALVKVFQLLRLIKPQAVHCHLFHANLVGLLAGKLAGVPKRVYTRHHSTYHHNYYPRAVTYDRVANHLSTHIVAISQNVKDVLVRDENVSPDKIHLIHHGFRLEHFKDVPPCRINSIRERYGIPSDTYPVVGLIARYIQWKGLQYAIPAFHSILQDYPRAHLLLANAQGSYKSEVQHLLSKLPSSSYTEIPFENDIPALYKLIDIYVHVPIDRRIEAFGQTYVEALVAGIPSVVTLSGIAHEFIRDNYNAVVVGYCDAEAIAQGVKKLIVDSKLKETLVKNGRDSIKDTFGLDRMIASLQSVYEEVS